MIDPVLFCILGLLLLAPVGAALAHAAIGRWLIYGGCLLLSLLLLANGLIAIPAGVQRQVLPIGLPWIGAHLRLDALSAFFLVLIGLGSASASLYALGYTRHEEHPQRVLPFYPLFLAGLNLVVVADDAFLFVFAWELMSLASWALVLADHRHPGNARAAFVYIVMATFSGLALLLVFGVLASVSGGYGFDTMRAMPPVAAQAGLVVMLALIGAGAKAGLVPLHVWLPLAHPAAPSHVSALMSGVMTKVAIYGFIRIAFDLLGGTSWWAALVVMLLGGITAVLGVLYALMERDLKRLLAYSTVDNVGIIFIGLGLALAFRADRFAAGAALALTAALVHAFNHVLFKSLLFFGAGAVVNATGARDLEQMGGLIHRMPRTAVAVLIGCVAIAALPPLNGFVSEWLTFQAILLHPNLPQWGLKVVIPADGALLALAAALAAACFVRAYGIAFLGRPRSTAARDARETDGFSLAAMALLATLCVLAGVVPGLLIDGLAPVVHALTDARMPEQLGSDWLTIVPVAESRSSYNGLLVFLFIAGSAWLTALAVHRFGSHALRRGPAWDCGFPDASPATQYTAGSFAQPIRRVFASVVFRAREQVTMPPPGDTAPARIVRVIHDPVWDTLYAPIGGGVARAADLLNHLQFLTIRRYLAMVFAALVLLLLVLALWQ